MAFEHNQLVAWAAVTWTELQTRLWLKRADGTTYVQHLGALGGYSCRCRGCPAPFPIAEG